MNNDLVPSDGGGSLVTSDRGPNLAPAPTNAVGAAMTAAAMSEIRLAMQLAQEFPRNMDHVRGRVLHLCKNPDFADKALYKYPRGQKPDGSKNFVEGKSV